MTAERFEFITGRYPQLRVALLGDFCLDRYFDIDPARSEISIETGLPVHNITGVRCLPGAAGTVLNNLVALGVGTIRCLGLRGDDGEGFELHRALAARQGVDLAGFVAEAKRRPGEITYGTPGVAHIGHFMGELLQLMAGIKLEHIPYRGGADVARELAGGRLDAGIISYSSLRPAVERGTTLLASTAAERQASLRQIPVIAETFPGYDLVSWTGCFALAGTPEAAQNRFVAAIHHALKDPAIQARLEATGADPVISSPAAYQAVIAKDRDVARRIVAATGLSIS